MSHPTADIETEDDIRRLVDTFYQKVRADTVLAPIFDDVAQVNWAEHLPRLYDFWSGLLLRTNRYQGHPLRHHFPLPINHTHFARWLALFFMTVDELFAGPVAQEAKLRAHHIGQVFSSRLALVRGQ
ncbi:group III truncated hemoglobin [Hymenobacter sp. NST-14]|uniref:group III truncated hemoglobin n=1 Tax=Hymenobacter piscis TaxID=2839984 RepID=UPI001C00913D|nr:group III truncated hemoglobin [Hymenobacter piscis]MBT9394999.1 group III truncated hemoglobin [Hymenobacter piscis]